MSGTLRMALSLAPEAMSPAQRWDRICQAVGEAHIARSKNAQAQSEAAEYLAGEDYEAACDSILILLLAPEAIPMINEAREFLHYTYGGRG